MAEESVIDKLTAQILGQNTTKYWTGQGFGSPEANARAMAGQLAAAGITDIKQFGKTKQDTGLRGIAKVEFVDPNDPSKGGYAIPGYDQEGMPIGEPVKLTPEQLASATPFRTQDNETGNIYTAYYTVPAPVYNVHLGNKETGAPISTDYGWRGGNIWSGTFAGKNSTAFGVQFGPDGTPYFYTQHGKATGNAQDFLPAAAFALNFIAPGAGTALGTALGASGAVATTLGNAIINGALTEAAGGDFWQGATTSAVSSVLPSVIPSTGVAAIDKAITSGVGAALSGKDVQDAILSGAMSGIASELGPGTGNKIVDNAISSGIKAALSGGDIGNAIVSGAMSGAGAEFKNASKQADKSAGDDFADLEFGGAGSDEEDVSLADLMGDVPVDNRDDINALIESGNGFTTDTGGTLADLIADIPADTRDDINALIESGNGLTTPATTTPSEAAPSEDFTGLPEAGAAQDTGGSLADVIGDVPVDTREDINANIESGNGYTDDFGGFPETATPEDTGGSLADVIGDVPVDDRADINAEIEAGNGYTSGTGTAGGRGSSSGSRPATGTGATTARPAQSIAGGTSGLDMATLLALLGGAGGGQSAPEKSTPEEDAVAFDWTQPLQLTPFAARTATPTMAQGGSIDDLLALLQQRG